MSIENAMEAPDIGPGPGRQVVRVVLEVERYVYADNKDMVDGAYADMANELKTVLPKDEFVARCEIVSARPEDHIHINDWLRERYEPDAHLP